VSFETEKYYPRLDERTRVEDVDPSIDLGKFCSYQQDYQESIDQGFELQKLGKFKDASDSYQRAVDLGASDASVYVNLGKRSTSIILR